ncbi:MAG: YdcF family protein [Pseudobacter sp.]|uniref:YdcF family protein n=1 Tax=Pseudobacter sp. TaxID=2045420 RepID=UPI003F80E67F
MKRTVIRLLTVCILVACFSGNTRANDLYELLTSRNFPLLLELSKMPDLKSIGVDTRDLLSVNQRMYQDAELALKECGSAGCFGKKLQFTEDEIDRVGNNLLKMAGTVSWKKMVKNLRAGHSYELFADESDTGFIRKCWIADAKGVNYILATYVEGSAPIYPKIDAISFQSNDTAYRSKIALSVRKILKRDGPAFFALPVFLAIDALILNRRLEAVNYLPLIRVHNKAPKRHTSKIKWENYRYSAILVPGLGPEQPDVKLDPGGARRCDSAVIRWRAGMAPFLLVSGGNVHPNQTPYNEAEEMKKYLVEVHKIPERAIIIDPHARHTTTNLRNANRIIKWMGIPFNKPVMIVTDASQNKYINGAMKDKVVKELGYIPFEAIKMLSFTESEYLPSLKSMHVNSLDPLDP